MSSIIKVGKVQSSTGQDAITIADSGTITATNIQTDSIKDDSGTRVLASDSGSAWSWGSGVPSGSIVQVQHTQITTNAECSNMSALTNYVVQDASNATSGGSVTGILGVNITPKIHGSKIWVQSSFCGELSGDSVYNSMFFYWKNSTKLGNTESPPEDRLIGIATPTISYHADDGGTTLEACFMQYFDTHGQSQSDINSGTQIRYKLGFICTNAVNLLINRTVEDANNNSRERGVSSICAIELAP